MVANSAVDKPTAQRKNAAGSARANPDPIFIADAMLGRLAKWLRLLGYDTLYARRETDHQIAAQARAQGRVVLTRDRGLAVRKGINCLLVDSEILEHQVREVAQAFGLDPGCAPRCPQCNTLLAEIDQESARPHVPPYVYQTQSTFRRCAQCARIYWPGSHWQHIQETIAQIWDGMDSTARTLG